MIAQHVITEHVVAEHAITEHVQEPTQLLLEATLPAADVSLGLVPDSVRARPFMVGLDLAGQEVLIVGGNRFAEEKIASLRSTQARIVVVAQSLTPNLAQLEASGQIIWKRRLFRPTDPRSSRLVIVADDEGSGVKKIRRWCARWRTLVNVVDQPDSCDLIMPSTLRCGPATVAVSTGGLTPAGARFLREEIERLLPERMGEVLDSAAQARVTLRETGAYRYDYQAWRRGFFQAGLERNDSVSLTDFRDDFIRNF